MRLHTTTRPQPDMLANGTPKITILRTTRARQVPITEDAAFIPRITPLSSSRPSKTRYTRLLFALGVVLTLACILGWQLAVVPWWNRLQDQWHYGDNRITQFDANVGHGGISHFLAEDYHGSFLLIEILEANPQNTHLYALTGLVSPNSNPVLQLSLQPGTTPGKPNLLLQVEGTPFTVLLFNTGTTFQQEGGV